MVSRVARPRLAPWVALLLSTAGAAAAADRLYCPPIFGDHMVLQRDMPVPVWGRAAPGQDVTVAFAGQSRTATADAAGRWQVVLEPLGASSDARELVVTGGGETLTFTDVVVGEVWLCSGQSNMVWQVARSSGVEDVVRDAEQPLIRMASIRGDSRGPLAAAGRGSRWFVTTPEIVGEFSAVGYAFCRELHRELQVPIGFILAASAGSPVETWLSRDAVAARPGLAGVLQASDLRWQEFQEANRLHGEMVSQWRRTHEGRLPTEEDLRAAGAPPRAGLLGRILGLNFDQAIEPLIPFAIRGVLWYQGESNAINADRYRELLTALIDDWRLRWRRAADPTAAGAELPFFMVQISNYGRDSAAPAESRLAEVREAQRQIALTVPNTGLAVAIDGDGDIHPRDKGRLGGRLARIALARTYGRPVAWSGPVPESVARDGAAMRIAFRHAEGGLVSADGKPLAQFAIAGADRVFQRAEATIEGSAVRVAAAAVPEPVAVRYAWSDNPVGCNLANAAGLPAAPFRTDDWPLAVIVPGSARLENPELRMDFSPAHGGLVVTDPRTEAAWRQVALEAGPDAQHRLLAVDPRTRTVTMECGLPAVASTGGPAVVPARIVYTLHATRREIDVCIEPTRAGRWRQATYPYAFARDAAAEPPRERLTFVADGGTFDRPLRCTYVFGSDAGGVPVLERHADERIATQEPPPAAPAPAAAQPAAAPSTSEEPTP